MENLIHINNLSYKICDVVVLESDKKAENGDLFINGLFRLTRSTSNNTNKWYNAQHIYILSDDEIKDGDWCIDNENKLRRCVGINDGRLSLEGISNLTVLKSTCKKIISTTNRTLEYYSKEEINGFSGDMPLPKPPNELIEEVIKNNTSVSTSNGTQIYPYLKILVEYKEVYFHGSGYYEKDELSVDERMKYSFMMVIKPKISQENSIHTLPTDRIRNLEVLRKIKTQFEARKQMHLESAQYQPEKIDSKWSANNTASLIDLLYLTVEEILNETKI